MQNIIQLGHGKCELFNPRVHLVARTLKKFSSQYLFIESDEDGNFSIRDNQKKLTDLLNE
jgi:hypothetical protein